VLVADFEGVGVEELAAAFEVRDLACLGKAGEVAGHLVDDLLSGHRAPR